MGNHIEKMAKEIYAAMQWGCKNNGGDFAPDWVEGGNSYAQVEARSKAQAVFDALIAAVPDLVWEDHISYLSSGDYVFNKRDKATYYKSRTIGEEVDLNYHNRAQVRAIFEGETDD